MEKLCGWRPDTRDDPEPEEFGRIGICDDLDGCRALEGLVLSEAIGAGPSLPTLAGLLVDGRCESLLVVAYEGDSLAMSTDESAADWSICSTLRPC